MQFTESSFQDLGSATLHSLVLVCIWMCLNMNGCIIHTSLGVYEWLLHAYIGWCMWMSALHVHLLVYTNSCFTCTSVGVCEQLLYTYVCWCIWTAFSHVHMLVCVWTADSHACLLVYMNGCFTCISVAAFRDHNNITTHLVSSQALWTTKYHTSCIITNSVWNLQYHHTSSIITNSCMDGTVSPHAKYHHKIFVWTIQYHHSTQYQLHITVYAVCVFFLSQNSNCLT